MKEFWSDLGSKLGVGLCGAGLLLVFLGWNGAASVDRVEAQFPYLISGGLAGLCLVVIGVSLIIVQNQRADRAELQRTLAELKAALGDDTEGRTDYRPPPKRPTPARYETGSTEPAPPSGDDQPAARHRTRKGPLRAE